MRRVIGVVVGLLMLVGVASAGLIDEAFRVRIINNTTESKGYILQHTKEKKVWVNIMNLPPQGIFHTHLIPGRYKYGIFDVDDTADEYETSNIDYGYFTVEKWQLEKGYIIFLKEYPYDLQGEDWMQ